MTATGADRLAQRMSALNSEGAYDVFTRATELEGRGQRVVHLEIGEPDFATPAHVLEAGLRALHNGETRYTSPAGLPALRTAIADSFAARGAPVDPESIIITPGGKPMLFYAALATVNPGDEVLVPDPGFPIYASAVRFAGGTPVSYGLVASARFTPDLDEIAARVTPHTTAIILNSPHNPTGGAIDRASLERLITLAEVHDLTILSDEVYDGLSFDELGSQSIATIPAARCRGIAIRSFSKTYAMTGWRLGYGIVPPDIVERITTLAVNGHSCVPAFVQHAGIAAISGPQDATRAMRDEFRRRRDWIVPELNAIPGVTCALPQGAFYAFPDVRGLLADSGSTLQGLADRLLTEFGVALLPGTAFGARGDGHLRISFVKARESLGVAIRALRACTTEPARSARA